MPSTRAVRKEKKKRAGKASEVHSEKGEEPVKRKKMSKHGSKKAAKKATKSRQSHDPEADEWELDIRDDTPREKLKETLTVSISWTAHVDALPLPHMLACSQGQ